MQPDNARLAREQLQKGKTLQRAGQLGVARSHYERAAKLDPHNAETWYLLGMVALESRGLPLAVKHFRKCIELRPAYAEAHNSLGNALRQLGKPDQAIAAFRAALAARPRYAEAMFNLGTTIEVQGDWASAEAAYRQALAWRENNVDAALRLGNLLGRQGRLVEGLPLLESAQQWAPERAQTWGNLAQVLSDLGRYSDAARCAHAAITREPQQSLWWRLLGVAERLQHDVEHAIGSLRKTVELAPGDHTARFELGLALSEAGAIEEARTVFANLQAPEGFRERLRWANALSLPAIYRDEAEVDAERARFSTGLGALDSGLKLESPQQLAEAYRAVTGVAPFHLHYQPRDNTELQCRFGDLLTRVMTRAAPQLMQPCNWKPLAHGGRLRVGFISSHLMQHTVSRYFGALITELDPQRFDVRVWYCGDKRDDRTDFIASRASAFTHTRVPALELAPQIRANELDVLVYPEVGMDPHHQALAALRLAPVQCLLYGHPATSGLKNVDYFLSGDALEPPQAQQHYCEQLVRLPGIGTRPQLPSAPGAGVWMDAYMSGTPLLLCLQNVIKLAPAFDTTLARIAAESGARIAFFARNTLLAKRFRARIEAEFAAHGLDPAQQLVFLPAQIYADYLAGIARAPLVLDSPWFSGGATSLDALSVGTPVVTWEGTMARGRQTAGMLRLIGIDELIAVNEDDYVAKAVALCSDLQQRVRLSERIRNQRAILFEDNAAISAFATFLEKTVT